MQHVVVQIGGDGGSIWAGIPLDRALRWSELFLRLRPVWPGAGAMWMLLQAVRRGEPAGVREWAHRARRAEAIGLTPDRYSALHASLDRVPSTEATTHPDNHLDRCRGGPPTRPFDDSLWASWTGLVVGGMTEDAATRLLLTARDAELAVTGGDFPGLSAGEVQV